MFYIAVILDAYIILLTNACVFKLKKLEDFPLKTFLTQHFLIKCLINADIKRRKNKSKQHNITSFHTCQQMFTV